MSLNYDLSKIAEEVKQHPENPELLNPVTEAMIWATMATTIWQITEDNWRRAYMRIHAWEMALGTYLKTKGEDGKLVARPITESDVYKHIGLKTNAFPEINGDEFAKKLYGVIRDRIRDEWASEIGFEEAQKLWWPVNAAEEAAKPDEDDDEFDEDEDY